MLYRRAGTQSVTLTKHRYICYNKENNLRKQKRSNNKMSQMPEASSVERSAEEEKRGTIVGTIDQILDADADEAEDRVSNNPNITAFKGWEEEAVTNARLDAMNNRMYVVLKDILGENSGLDNDKVKIIANNYVSSKLTREIAASTNHQALEAQFK
jgi:hypothetical protein